MTTQTNIVPVPAPSGRKWPYILGGFIAGIASVFGVAAVAVTLEERKGTDCPDEPHCTGEAEELETCDMAEAEEAEEGTEEVTEESTEEAIGNTDTTAAETEVEPSKRDKEGNVQG